MFSGINEYIVYLLLVLSPDGFTKFSIWSDNFGKSTYVTYRYSTEEYGIICNIFMNNHYSVLFKIGSVNCGNTLAESLHLVHVYIFDYLNYCRGFSHMVEESLFQSYLPGTGDTVIMKAVLPRWGSAIALRLGWLLRLPQMWVTRVRNFCLRGTAFALSPI